VSGPARTGFFELDAAGLEAWCGARGMPRFAARQLGSYVAGLFADEPGKHGSTVVVGAR